jgi:hypothetical protein
MSDAKSSSKKKPAGPSLLVLVVRLSFEQLPSTRMTFARGHDYGWGLQGLEV